VLMTFPLVLGSGKRLFGEGTPARSMRMVEHRVTSRGTSSRPTSREARSAPEASRRKSRARPSWNGGRRCREGCGEGRGRLRSGS
jgi:hypothetical protein